MANTEFDVVVVGAGTKDANIIHDVESNGWTSRPQRARILQILSRHTSKVQACNPRRRHLRWWSMECLYDPASNLETIHLADPV